MADRNSRWSRDELLLAFNLYCRTPFGKMHSRNPEVIYLSKLIGRTSSSVAMKLVNFASLDPDITSSGRAGLGNASAGDRAIWSEFHQDWERLALESVEVLKVRSGGEKPESDDTFDINAELSYEGVTKSVLTKVRVKQSFFRKSVLAGYQNRCCISGVLEQKLLVASHIVPWSEDKLNRLNPRNGLCLSSLHDRAFDQGLITVTPDFKVRVAKQLRSHRDNAMIDSAIVKMEGRSILLPEKFLPGREFLMWHNKYRFEQL
ncbi:MAG: HNH endonuclease [Burkholderiales bacterium]|nr:HNH endonuclease [Burkholderiales bacterium]